MRRFVQRREHEVDYDRVYRYRRPIGSCPLTASAAIVAIADKDADKMHKGPPGELSRQRLDNAARMFLEDTSFRQSPIARLDFKLATVIVADFAGICLSHSSVPPNLPGTPSHWPKQIRVLRENMVNI